MQRAVVLLALAACDRIYGLDGRLEPDGGGSNSGDDGAMPPSDGASTGCAFVEPSTALIAADAWYPDAALATAVRKNGAGFIELGHSTGKTVDMLTESNYGSAFVSLPVGYSSMFFPSMSGDGTLLVGSLANDDNVTFRLAIGTRNTQVFGNPALVDLRTASGTAWTLGVTDVPSGPTSVTPRRMLISQSQRIVEVVQNGSQWRATGETLVTSIGLNAISYATLSTDGLAMILVGTVVANPGAQKVLRATRTSVDGPFGEANEIFRPLGTGVSAAYLVADCSKLYFVQQGEVRYVER